MAIQIVLVDDSERFLEAAKKFLDTVPGLKVVGATTVAQDSLRLAAELQPDLVLMDIKMAGMNGIEAARNLKALLRPPYIILLTLHDTPEYRAASVAVGADGFVSKANFGTQLVPEIYRLFSNQYIQF